MGENILIATITAIIFSAFTAVIFKVGDFEFGSFIWKESQIRAAEGSKYIKMDSIDVNGGKITFIAKPMNEEKPTYRVTVEVCK